MHNYLKNNDTPTSRIVKTRLGYTLTFKIRVIGPIKNNTYRGEQRR